MHFGQVKLSTAETEFSLQKDNFEPDTGAYEKERYRRYRQRGRGRWVEREDWDPSVPPPVAVYSGEEVEMIILRLKGDEPVDILLERSRLFKPCSPDPEDDRWVKEGEWSSVRKPEPTKTKSARKVDQKAVGKGFAFVGAA